jgi:D-mannonate dehydratase
VVDWTRTDLMYRLPTTGYALRFDAIDFAAYDLFVLKRSNAEASYSPARITEAQARLKTLSDEQIDKIERNLIAGLPATERSYNRETMRGNPYSEKGGSSGWMHMRAPTSSATGMISFRNQARLARSSAGPIAA